MKVRLDRNCLLEAIATYKQISISLEEEQKKIISTVLSLSNTWKGGAAGAWLERMTKLDSLVTTPAKEALDKTVMALREADTKAEELCTKAAKLPGLLSSGGGSVGARNVLTYDSSYDGSVKSACSAAKEQLISLAGSWATLKSKIPEGRGMNLGDLQVFNKCDSLVAFEMAWDAYGAGVESLHANFSSFLADTLNHGANVSSKEELYSGGKLDSDAIEYLMSLPPEWLTDEQWEALGDTFCELVAKSYDNSEALSQLVALIECCYPSECRSERVVPSGWWEPVCFEYEISPVFEALAEVYGRRVYGAFVNDPGLSESSKENLLISLALMKDICYNASTVRLPALHITSFDHPSGEDPDRKYVPSLSLNIEWGERREGVSVAFQGCMSGRRYIDPSGIATISERDRGLCFVTGNSSASVASNFQHFKEVDVFSNHSLRGGRTKADQRSPLIFMNDYLNTAGKYLDPADAVQLKSASTIGKLVFAGAETSMAWYSENEWENTRETARIEHQNGLDEQASRWLKSEVSNLQVSVNADGTTSTHYYINSEGKAVFEWMQ